MKNNVKKYREELLLGRSELASLAETSARTIKRIEEGRDCHLFTKRKILKALNVDIKDVELVFPSKSTKPSVGSAKKPLNEKP